MNNYDKLQIFKLMEKERDLWECHLYHDNSKYELLFKGCRITLEWGRPSSLNTLPNASKTVLNWRSNFHTKQIILSTCTILSILKSFPGKNVKEVQKGKANFLSSRESLWHIIDSLIISTMLQEARVLMVIGALFSDEGNHFINSFTEDTN